MISLVLLQAFAIAACQQEVDEPLTSYMSHLWAIYEPLMSHSWAVLPRMGDMPLNDPMDNQQDTWASAVNASTPRRDPNRIPIKPSEPWWLLLKGVALASLTFDMHVFGMRTAYRRPGGMAADVQAAGDMQQHRSCFERCTNI